jgi:hypothetical protein
MNTTIVQGSTGRLALSPLPTIAPVDNVLAQEIDFFEANKDEFREEHIGEWILVKGTAIIGFYKDRSKALKEGYRRFGEEAFLIKEVTAEDEVIDLFPIYLNTV